MPYIFYILIIIFGFNMPVHAAREFSTNNDLCKYATTHAEKKFNIPLNLLHAIAMTESGRWVAEDKANFAWPWTVTSGGDGQFFPTKAAAIAHVRTLQSRGVTNIDVGCMQINLFYHPDAFENLDQAFDPYKNALYGAQFLSSLFYQTKSWSQAAGRYHSSDTDKNLYYREKVLENWRVANQDIIQRKDDTSSDVIDTIDLANTENTNDQTRQAEENLEAALIENQNRDEDGYLAAPRMRDENRMAKLNAMFRQRKAQQRAAILAYEEKARNLNAYQQPQTVTTYTRANAARQRAIREANARNKLLAAQTAPLTDFDRSQHRQSQLNDWRDKIANPALLNQE